MDAWVVKIEPMGPKLWPDDVTDGGDVEDGGRGEGIVTTKTIFVGAMWSRCFLMMGACANFLFVFFLLLEKQDSEAMTVVGLPMVMLMVMPMESPMAMMMLTPGNADAKSGNDDGAWKHRWRCRWKVPLRCRWQHPMQSQWKCR